MSKIMSSNIFRALMPIVDLLIILGSNYLCFYLYKDVLENFVSNYYSFLKVFPYMAIGYVILARAFDIEKPKDTSFFGLVYTTSLIIVILLFFTMSISFLVREFSYPRSILLTSSVIQILGISLWYWIANNIYQSSLGKERVLIIGEIKARELAYKLLENKTSWSNITRICYHKSEFIHEQIDQNDIIFIAEDVSEDRKQNIIRECIEKNKKVLYEPKSKEILLFNSSIKQIEDSPILQVQNLGISSGEESFKRIVDVMVAIVGAVVFLIPAIIIYCILKSRGKTAFYSQERITRGHKIFRIYKFRTMIEDAEKLSGPTLAQDVDPRITKFGHFLRSTRLDEIPQIFNILKGDMSIVGPRPERPFFVEKFEAELPEYNLRTRVKAGLTGLAQVQGRYNTTVTDKLKYDLLYINAFSIALDIKIMLQTLNILLRKDSTQGIKDPVDLNDKINELWLP